MTEITKPADPDILELYRQWRSLEGKKHNITAYKKLQRRITAMRPTTTAELAAQYIVETDDLGSEPRKSFLGRMKNMARDAAGLPRASRATRARAET